MDNCELLAPTFNCKTTVLTQYQYWSTVAPKYTFCTNGAEKRTNGAEKRTNGAEKRKNGSEKRTSGAEKRTNGSEKRTTNGAEKRTNGAEKRKCTLGPPYWRYGIPGLGLVSGQIQVGDFRCPTGTPDRSCPPLIKTSHGYHLC